MATDASATDTTTAITTPEAQWVEGELIRHLMSTARSTQVMALLVVPVIPAVLYSSAVTWHLVLWTVLAIAVSGYRLWIIEQYRRRLTRSGTDQQLLFIRKYRVWWPIAGLVWGLSAFLHFDRIPPEQQFVCWLIITGLASFAVISFSPHRPTQRGYINGLMLAVLSVVVLRVALDLRFAGPIYHYVLIFLIFIYWALLYQTGDRLHNMYRKTYELRYRNAQLIESLTRQTTAALQAVEVKNRFLASAAHDLRQPVHALALYADWLRSEPELVSEITPKIVKSTQAVNALFDSLFDLGRLDAGGVQVNIQPVDVASLFADLELQYRPLADARGLQLRMHLRAGAAPVVSDPILLRRVLGNLISNAIKYTCGGGVLVAARSTHAGVRFEVWDTGTGIAAENLGRIFDEFYKVPGHAGTEDGFGLGLSIISRLAGILGHPLSVASREGRGSVFRLLVRSSDDAAGRSPTSDAAPVPGAVADLSVPHAA